MFIVFFGSVIIKDSPLNAVQMLWVNLVMDTLGALSLATEPPAVDVLTRPPQPKDEAIVNEVMWRNIFGHAIIQIFILMLIIFGGPTFLGFCHPYEVLCTQPKIASEPDGVCLKFNPYYAQGLYETAASVEFWKETIAKHKIGQQNSVSQWDSTIDQFRCDFQNAAAAPGAVKCDSSTLEAKFKSYTPLNLKVGDET
jgi:hypothetical protein